MPNITQGPSPASTASGWTNSNNIFLHDGNYALVNLAHGQTSPSLKASGFGFSIPSFATILGISLVFFAGEITFTGSATSALVQLLKANIGTGTNKDNSSNWGAAPQTFNYGGSGDLWGASWLPSDINDPGFGVQLQVKDVDPSASLTAGVDYLTLSVTYFINTSFFGVINTE